ncbi:MAG: TlpA family protein disulfide reductase, partial [Bacteroidetes bacterium]|nr:TlpA family protein disulfide reductase [Bacteroidota bacterium]
KSSSLKLSDFKDKIVVLDFWATWCSSCLAGFPQDRQLQKQLKDSIQIILVNSKNTRNKHAEIVKFFEARNHLYEFPSIDEDTVLCRLFPGAALPNLVWIRNSKVIALPAPEELTLNNLRSAYRGKSSQVLASATKFPDLSKSIIPGDFGKDAVYYSYLGSYRPGFIPRGDMQSDSNSKIHRIDLVNYPLETLIEFCFRMDNQSTRRIIKRVPNPEAFSTDSTSVRWQNQYCFSYESVFSPRSAESAFGLMKNDIERYFQIKIDSLVIDTPCFVVSSGDTSKLLHAKKDKKSPSESNISERLHMPVFFHVQSVDVICRQLEQFSNGIYVNESNFKDNINLTLPEDLDDFKAMAAAFASQGLRLTRQKRKISFLRITAQPELTNPYITNKSE